MKDKDLKLLRQELTHEMACRRYEAAILLGQCESMLSVRKDPEFVGWLIPLLKDEDWHVRYYAAEALGNLGFPGAIDSLEVMRTDSNEKVVKAANQALVRIRAGE